MVRRKLKMPTIHKIRFSNVQFANGEKRYDDETFHFGDKNSILILENGGGKTVFIQAAMQAIIPHSSLGDRTIKDTLYLENGPAHIAIEWTLNEKPKQYVVTAVTLYRRNNLIESLRYVYTYGERDEHRLEQIPFILGEENERYVATREQMLHYYQTVAKDYPARAKLFPQSIKAYREYIEEHFLIMRKEWENIGVMNSSEGGIEKVFSTCKTTQELFDRLLIPSVEQADLHLKKEVLVDQFETQRKSLQKHKELEEQIKSYAHIHEQLNEYVQQFAHYDQALKQYHNKKIEAVLYYTYLERKKKEAEEQIRKTRNQIEQIREEQREAERFKKRIQIYEQQQKLTQEQKNIQNIERQLHEIVEQLKEYEQQKYSLQFAKYRDSVQKAEQMIQSAEEQIRKEDEKFDMQGLTKELQQLEGKLLFLLKDEYRAYEEERIKLNRQSHQLKKEKSQYEKQFSDVKFELQQIDKDKTIGEVRRESELEKAERLKKELVAHPEEKVEQLLKEWRVRLVKLAETIHKMETERLQIETERLEKQRQLEKNEEERQALKIAQTTTSEQLKALEKEEEALKSQLRSVIHHVPTQEKIYQKEQTIQEQLRYKIQVFEKERQESLIEERQVLRQIDDYEQQETFFADAYIATKLDLWASQFTYLQTGAQYVNLLQSTSSSRIADYPFWANSLITTEQECDKLKAKLSELDHQLTVPILVLSRADATKIYNGEAEIPREWKIPAYWHSHIQLELFEEWKKSAREAANEAIGKREQVEQALELHKRYDYEFNLFMKKYPYEHYQTLKQQQFEQQQRDQQLAEERIRLSEAYEKLKATLQDIRQQMIHDKEESRMLEENRIPKALDYERAIKNAQLHQEKVEQLMQNLKKKEEEMRNVEKNKKEVNAQLRKNEEKLQESKSFVRYRIETHPIYQRKQEILPIKTKENQQVLEQKMKTVENRRNQISNTIQSFEITIKYESTTRDKSNAKLEEIIQICPTVNRQQKYFGDTDQQIIHFEERIKKSKVEREQKKKEKGKTLEKIRTIEGELKVHMEQYGEAIPEQTESLISLKERYAKTEQRLQEQLVYEEHLLNQEEKQYEKMSDAYDKTQTFYYVHELNKIVIQTETLPPSAYTAFSYEWMSTIAQLKTELELLEREKNEQQNRTVREKSRFLRFSETIADPRMKKDVVQGIERNNTYEELTQHRQQVQKRLEQATYTAEQTMQGYDRDLQQIILYAIRQLDNIRYDLLEIPKRTKVPIAGVNKTIFQFRIPEWQEEEAKQKIQNYLSWLVDQLKKSEFFDENGQENRTVVRKFLEQKLQMTALLRVVLDNQVMQVKCRKVQSIDHVSSTYYSWEQSNKWSGGEQWSKNMALYLGLLKYIAEKSGKQMTLKRDRVLMLDNPFGKASSDHVLQPVFYISEKLGFQIIALTAHGENKFVTDYFPVVYSCRLRSTKDHTHEVMELKTLHFEDQVPEVIQMKSNQKQAHES